MEKNIKIRMARAQDAETLARIYAYYVEKTAITFEHEAPDAAEMETRRKKVFEHYPRISSQSRKAVCSATSMRMSFTGGLRLVGRSEHLRRE